MPHARPRKPAITKIGTVEALPDGSIRLARWHLDTCMTRCHCHRQPITGQLVLRYPATGGLGLHSFTNGQFRCACCDPWTVDELAAIVRDFIDLEALRVAPHVEGT